LSRCPRASAISVLMDDLSDTSGSFRGLCSSKGAEAEAPAKFVVDRHFRRSERGFGPFIGTIADFGRPFGRREKGGQRT
ncbi:MAG: hypothetical protein ACK5VE_06340, partial [Alphaproteobacteria bacterium]